SVGLARRSRRSEQFLECQPTRLPYGALVKFSELGYRCDTSDHSSFPKRICSRGGGSRVAEHRISTSSGEEAVDTKRFADRLFQLIGCVLKKPCARSDCMRWWREVETCVLEIKPTDVEFSAKCIRHQHGILPLVRTGYWR